MRRTVLGQQVGERRTGSRLQHILVTLRPHLACGALRRFAPMTRHALAAALAALLLVAPAAGAAVGNPDDNGASPATLAIIGDTPYGADQIASFPSDIAQINDDRSVHLTIHLGDIKNGSSVCSDDYFSSIRSDFDTFKRPLVYTPGDNEWTDCHRANNGGYLPTERLAKVRSVFFDEPGATLGRQSRYVEAQGAPFVENVRFSQSRTVIATVNVPGSNNDLVPWFGAAETPAQKALQADEVSARTAAALAWIDHAFDVAGARDSAAVVIGMQADMWDPEAGPANLTGYDSIKAKLADRAAHFGRPVLLLEGDSHLFKVDHPLAGAPNLTRIVVQGSTNLPREWLKLHIEPRDPSVFSWETIPFAAV
jgi:calcineurin-like phosphoesterase family protein